MSFFSTSGLARITSRHPWYTVAFWVIALVLAGWQASFIFDRSTTEFTMGGNPDSVAGLNLIEERMGEAPPFSETLVLTSTTLTVDDPAYQEVIQNATNAVRGVTDLVDPAATYNFLELQANPDPAIAAQAEQLISADRKTTLIPVTMLSDEEPETDVVDTYLAAVSSSSTGDVTVRTIGTISINEAFTRISEEDLAKGETIGILVALVILIIVFRALVAVGIPIGLAMISIAIATGLSSVIAAYFDISFFVTNMISMIGLAVGIDYALFIVERYREERRHGRPKYEAIEVTGGTASKAVLFSGLTVVFALFGMFLIPTTIFRSLGLGAVLVVTVAVLAMLTLVPAVLALLGDKIDWPIKRKYDDPARIAAQRERDKEGIHKGFWGRLTKTVMGHPVIALVLSAGLLIALAIPYFSLNTGFNGASTLPPSDVRDAYDILANDFQAGRLGPIKIVIDGTPAEVQAGIDKLNASLALNPVTASFEPVVWSPNGDLAVIDVNLTTESDSHETRVVIDDLRDSVIPAAFAGVPASVYVSGEPAFNYDFQHLVDTWTPIVFLFVLALSFILLTLAFRSIVVPMKAILMNLLGVGAAYGILVLVFQEGHLTSLLGFEQTPVIEPWLPIFLFCVLFGLSMDYHVFLLSRIREHYDLTHRNAESVAAGLQSTARIITGAALIMVAVFFGFAGGRLVMFQQMGFGLGIAVLIDATIIRSILVPSAMALLGDRNWYMPKWLRWLPDLRVEGSAPPIITTPVQPGISAAGD